ncbi:MAG TPA: SDR family NAD(P)-dependent oxidoreductase [Pseudomonadota bacterium]|nr:SDR family NAD(P)-dependent oxidoreductase [Pseudomonadota bacterium]
MTGRFEGKVAVVTAGGSGIGAATARRFTGEGASVVIADISGTRAEQVAGEIAKAGGTVRWLKMDASEPEGVQAAVRLALDNWGRLDVMFNNAGLSITGPLEEMTLETWNRVLAVTLTSTFLGIKYSLPIMRKQGSGAIVNTASISGLAGDYGMAAYNAAKAGVVNLTRTAAIEYARKNIRVNAVCPGMVATPAVLDGFIAQSRNPERARQLNDECHPIGRMGKPEEIARVVLFLASDDASFMTGSIVVADGGVTAHTGLTGHPLR